MRRSALLAGARTLAAIPTVAIAFASLAGCSPDPSRSNEGAPRSGAAAPSLRLDVNTDRAVGHMQALQKIADSNGGNRASGKPGYAASVDYVAGVLRQANLDVATPEYELTEEDQEDGTDQTRARNVIARTRGGDPNRVVVVGAHLDSVTEGPGLVDNGSGVAAVLEIATRLAAAPPNGNTVLFGLWGSEETGLGGSTSFVESIPEDERDKVMLYLNLDMIASSNGAYLVQGGFGDGTEETGPSGSGEVAQVLIDKLAETGVKAERIPFVGDDDAPFIEAGIPTAGAESGDAKEKTAAQARVAGGQAGQVYDPCYHQACDRMDNVNRQLFDHYLRAASDTVTHFVTPQNTLGR